LPFQENMIEREDPRAHAHAEARDISRERNESWLYDAVQRYVREDPALRADYPYGGSEPERMLRVVCRVVESMVGTFLASAPPFERERFLKEMLGSVAQSVELPAVQHLLRPELEEMEVIADKVSQDADRPSWGAMAEELEAIADTQRAKEGP
jgi:hypothetical protein